MRTRALTLTLALALASLLASIAAADSQQPIISGEDHGSEGPVARHVIRTTLSYVRLTDGAMASSADVFAAQVVLGPKPVDGALREALDFLGTYAVRLRLTGVRAEDDFHAGPLTLALQRYFISEPLTFAPLLSIHAGLEGALSTPWLGDRRAPTPAVLAEVGAIDTELAGNGWGVRPGGYVRLDFLVCRNFYIEGGLGLELFIPTRAGPREYGSRWHLGTGLSLGCSHRATSLLHRVSVAVEYRGRGRAYADQLDPDYHDLLSLGLQIDFGHFTLGIYQAYDPLITLSHRSFGVRVQTGVWRRK